MAVGQKAAIYELGGEAFCLGTIVGGSPRVLNISFDDDAIVSFKPNEIGQFVNEEAKLSAFILPTSFPNE